MLFCYEQFDELTLLHLREFDKKKMISVETDIVVDHYKEEKFEEHKPGLLLLLRPLCERSCCCGSDSSPSCSLGATDAGAGRRPHLLDEERSGPQSGQHKGT